jgi:hypothetical protein
MKETKRSIYQFAGDWGIPFGLYLTCAALASIYADKFQPLTLVFLILLLGLPLVTYALQRRKFVEDNGFTEYAGLWMLGIVLYILGAVVSGFIVYLVLQYLRPGFMYEQAQFVIDAYEKMPEAIDSRFVDTLRLAMEKHLMPSPIQIVFSAFWLISFGGSLISALTALFAQRPLNRRQQR